MRKRDWLRSTSLSVARLPWLASGYEPWWWLRFERACAMQGLKVGEWA